MYLVEYGNKMQEYVLEECLSEVQLKRFQVQNRQSQWQRVLRCGGQHTVHNYLHLEAVLTEQQVRTIRRTVPAMAVEVKLQLLESWCKAIILHKASTWTCVLTVPMSALQLMVAEMDFTASTTYVYKRPRVGG